MHPKNGTALVSPPIHPAVKDVKTSGSGSTGEWQEPVLYIFSVDLIVQVWLEGEKIYQYGEFNADGRGRFEGRPWHEIVLPENYEGKPVYFRIFSN